jgi:hypothetical protein
MLTLSHLYPHRLTAVIMLETVQEQQVVLHAHGQENSVLLAHKAEMPLTLECNPTVYPIIVILHQWILQHL